MASNWSNVLRRKDFHLAAKAGKWSHMRIMTGKKGIVSAHDIHSHLINRDISIKHVDGRVIRAGLNRQLASAIKIWPCAK